jgi:hypothetical protein
MDFGAGDEIRTRDIDLGKVALYQLSYSRLKRNLHSHLNGAMVSNTAAVKPYGSRRGGIKLPPNEQLSLS